MYNTFDGQFNPKRKFETRVESFFRLALVCDITVCVTIPQHQGLNVQKQGKIQYGL